MLEDWPHVRGYRSHAESKTVHEIIHVVQQLCPERGVVRAVWCINFGEKKGSPNSLLLSRVKTIIGIITSWTCARISGALSIEETTWFHVWMKATRRVQCDAYRANSLCNVHSCIGLVIVAVPDFVVGRACSFLLGHTFLGKAHIGFTLADPQSV